MTAILIDSSNVPFLNEEEKQKLFDEQDVESGVKRSNTVAEARLAIRLGFLRKVFGILAVQLLMTTAVGVVFVSTPVLKAAVIQWSWMMPLGLFMSIGLLIAMMIKRNDYPANFILLFLWTGCQSYTVGVVASFAEKDVVIQAFFLTTVVVISLLFYTMQTKRDFSAMGSSLFAVLCVLIIGGILQMFLMNHMLEFVLSLGGAVLFSLFIIYDVQMIMNTMAAEEYILATITLYLDIINLFLHILRLLSALRRG